MESTAIEDEGCAREEDTACVINYQERICSPRKEENNISVCELENVPQDTTNTESQSSSPSGDRKRSFSEEILSCPLKKQKLSSIIQKLLTDPVVKVVRSPAVEQLVLEYRKKEDEKQLEEGWPGWECPNPTLRHTQNVLQRVINETDQLRRGKAASKQWQAKQLTQEATESNSIESLEQVVTTLERNEAMEGTGECRNAIVEDTSGFCGYDLDLMIGNFRGWEKPKTKSRDILRRLISELEERFTLGSALEEADHDVTQYNKTLQYKKQSPQNNFVHSEISNLVGQDIKLDLLIEQHLKELMKFVAEKPALEPPFSYMVLVIMALKSSHQSSLPLGDILEYIRNQFHYYRTANGCWMNSVHQTVHWSDIFTKTCSTTCHVKKSQDHGGCWTVDPVIAEEILGRAVDMQTRKAGGNLRFVGTPSSSLSTKKKDNFSKTIVSVTTPPVNLNQPLKNSGNHHVANGFFSAQSLKKKQNLVKKKMIHTSTPLQLNQPLKAANKLSEAKVNKSKIMKIKKKRNSEEEVKNKTKTKEEIDNKPCDKIHLILKAAENLESQNTVELPKAKKESSNHKENLDADLDKDTRVKIHKHLKELMKCVSDDISVEPPFSFMVLVVMALKSSSHPSLPLQDIFLFIRDNFPYYRTGNESWMKIVERTISWSDLFIKTCPRYCNVKKSQDHGGCWTIDTVTAEGILGRAVEAHRRKGIEKSSEPVCSSPNSPQNIYNCETNESCKDEQNMVNSQSSLDTGAENIQNTINSQSSLVMGVEDTQEMKNSHLSPCKRKKGSREITHPKLYQNLTGTELEDAPDMSKTKLSSEESFECSQETNNSEQPPDISEDTTISQESLNPDSQEILKNYNPRDIYSCVTNECCNDEQNMVNSQSSLVTGAENIQNTINSQSSLVMEVEDTQEVKNSHLSPCKSTNGSSEIKYSELYQNLIGTKSEDTPDMTKTNLSSAESFECSQETNNSEQPPEISQESLNYDSQEILENDHSEMPIESNQSNQTNGYQNVFERFVDIQDSSQSSVVLSDSYENESDDNKNTLSYNDVDTKGDFSGMASSNEYQTFYCQECRYTFTCMFFLKYHKCTKEATDTPYPCYICHTPFKEEQDFCFHLQTYHKGMINKHEHSSVCWTLKHLKLLSKKSQYKCTLCPAAFPFQELVEAHVRFVH